MTNPFLDHQDLVDSYVQGIRALITGNSVELRICDARAALGASYPISWLRDRLGLTETEERVAWLLIAHELDPEARRMIREMATESALDPTFDVIRRVVYGAGASLKTWKELGPDGKLRRLGIIERTDGSGDVAEQRQTFKIARRILALAHGDTGIDSELEGVATAGDVGDFKTLEIDDAARERIADAIEHPQLVVVYGRAGSGRRSILTALAEQPTLQIDARAIAPQRDRAQRQLRIAARECRLLAHTPLLLHLDALGEDRIDLVEHELPGLTLATASRAVARRWRTAVTQIELPPLPASRTAALWQRALPQASDADARLLATMYPLAPALVSAAGAAARGASGERAMQPEHVEAGIAAVLDDRLAGLATRVAVTQSWDDLVLPDDQVTAIVELLSRIRERSRVYETWGFANKLGKGLGVSALFSGPPGTGKTMAAALVARDLGVALYRVDTSKITSKWIGETEKNLAALFDAAEAGCAILLFDEADALFGKRTDVKSSNDRHANAETNYLLQRLESFTGVCILTTNHESAIDEAFRRRLSVHVRFPVPDADERARLWRALIPATAPTAPELALDKLAETFSMSGGYIRNAVVRAAFLAADEDAPIDTCHLQRAARLEYDAMGRVI
jgi:vesicle-fusing ATPase